MTKNIWNAETKCPSYKKKMKKSATRLGGIEVRAWKCEACNEAILHPADAQKALLIAKLNKDAAEVKVGEIREAPYIRFPKELGIIIHKGDIAIIKPTSLDEISVKIHHSH